MKVWLSLFLVSLMASAACGTYTQVIGWEAPDAVYNAVEGRDEVMTGANVVINIVAGNEGTAGDLVWDPRLPDPGVTYTEDDVTWAVTALGVGATSVWNGDVTVVRWEMRDTVNTPIAGALHANLLHHPVFSDEGVWKDGTIGAIQILNVQGGVDTSHPDGAAFGDDLYTFTAVAGDEDTWLQVNDWILPAGNNPYGNWPLTTSALWLRGGIPNPDYDPEGYPKEIWDPDCPPFGCYVPNPEYDPDDPRAIAWGVAPLSGEFELPDGMALMEAYIIPEPATVALLGIGTLVLLRRRR